MSTNNDSPYIGIRDIARLANVSTATVSRVINHPEQTSPQIRARVKAVIDQQHYVPNQTVKNLFARHSDSIALFVSDISNPFYISLLQELNQLAFANKHTLLICNTSNDAQKEQDYLDYCAAIRAKGIIITEGYDFVSSVNNLHIPLVMLDRSGMNIWSSVQSDNSDSIFRAVNYLYNLNHRRIAFASPRVESSGGFLSLYHRWDGYRNAMDSYGLFRQEYAYTQADALNVTAGINALNYFLSLPEPPTAILCANDMVAHGILLRAQELNIEIPQQLSVIGFDGIPSPFFIKQLTTIRQNIPAIAETLFKLCLQPPTPPRHITIPTEFIPGQTCGFCRKKI